LHLRGGRWRLFCLLYTVLGYYSNFMTNMVKRKVSGECDVPYDIIKRKKVSITSEQNKGNIDCTNPKRTMETLLGNVKLDHFFDSYWEKKPLVIKRNDPTFYGTLFSLSTLKEVLKCNDLDFLSDVNVCRYINGEKELLNEEGQITSEDVDRLMNEKNGSFQFHHPQRYVDNLWNLLEKMETFYGSLVGSNIYITPSDSQGLAPHCDDVEIFVLQLEGKKEWKLYKPMVELSRDYTQDLLQESIGKPMMEVILEPGDLLYFPRGVIHQCRSVGNEHSTHISISTYQQNTWGDFMNHAVTQAIENALEDDVTFRSGLPINYLSMLGTGKNISQYIEDEEDKNKHSNLSQEKVKDFKEKVQNRLSKLVEHIDVNTAADAMCADFMSSRLPPFGYTPKEIDEVKKKNMPKISDRIKIRYPEHIRVVYNDEDEENDDFDEGSDDDEMNNDEKPIGKDKSKSPKLQKRLLKIDGDNDDDDDDDDDDADVPEIENHIKIMHSLDNNRFTHMGSEVFEEEPGCVKLHVSFAKAMVELQKSNDFLSVKDLDIIDEEDKLTLASTLMANDLIEVEST